MHAKLQALREKRANGDHGFTLIELLVVVVIIGILVAIAIPLYLNYRNGAQNKSAASDVRNAITAVEACAADNNSTPPAAATAVSSKGGSIYLTCVSDGSGVASTTATGANQTINISDGDTLSYQTVTGGYTIIGKYGTGKTYTYTSTTGKTTVV